MARLKESKVLKKIYTKFLLFLFMLDCDIPVTRSIMESKVLLIARSLNALP